MAPPAARQAGTVDMSLVLKKALDNRLLRFLVRQLAKYCSRERASHIEAALTAIIEGRQPSCPFTRFLAVPLVRAALRRASASLGLEPERVLEKFRDPYWRRGLAATLNGVAKFGIRRPFVPGAPYLVVWDFTYACNLRCKHCYAAASGPLPNELKTEEALKVVDQLAEAGVTALAFSGGEPLLRKDFLEVASRARDYGIYVAVATNGTLIDREYAKKLAKVVSYIQVSLDGADPKTHNEFRGVPGAFERALRGIKNALEAGITVEIATTATRFNYEEIPKIIDLCEKLGVRWFSVFNFVPVGRGREIVEWDLDPETRERLLRYLWERNKRSPVNIVSTAPQYARVALEIDGPNARSVPVHFYNPQLPERLTQFSEFLGGCGAGRMYCAIRPDGTVTPCVFLQLPVGNLRKDRFEELWDSSEVFWDLRDREKLKGGCGECPYKYVCGGCRARAYNYFGDYLAPDPGCVRNAALFAELREKLAKSSPPASS